MTFKITVMDWNLQLQIMGYDFYICRHIGGHPACRSLSNKIISLKQLKSQYCTIMSEFNLDILSIGDDDPRREARNFQWAPGGDMIKFSQAIDRSG